MKKSFYIVSLLFFIVLNNCKAQDSAQCGFNRNFFSTSYSAWYQKALLEISKTQPIKRSKVYRDTEYVIPVVFHLIYPVFVPLDIGCIPKIMAEINADFMRLNADSIHLRSKFKSRAGNPKIRFVLATQDEKGQPSNGYTIRNSLNFFGIEPYQPLSAMHSMKFDATEGTPPWNTKKYLNIWVCNLQSPISFRKYLSGFATPPQNAPHWTSNYYGDSLIDGVVIDNSAYSNTSRSSVLTHEIGHYLGLRHVSGDPTVIDSLCSYDDSIFDTPRVLHQNSFTCDTTINSCIESINDFPDMLENFMDYTGNGCRNTFTKQQVAMMRYCLKTLRPDLASSLIKTIVTPAIFSINVFPNPNNGSLNIDFKDSFSRDYNVIIFDFLGRKVVDLEIVEPKSTLNLENVSSGIYQLVIQNKQSEIVFRKSLLKN